MSMWSENCKSADNSFLLGICEGAIKLFPDTHLMPVHIDDTISSLSAILLDEDYYRFLLNGRTEINSIPVLDAEHIIPFKMKAWLDLSMQKEAGVHVDSKI